MPEYRIEWSIEVEAESPEAAAGLDGWLMDRLFGGSR